MFDNLNKYKIILGSGSPRRKELLQHLKIPFDIRVSDVDEIIPDGMDPMDVPVYLSELKSQHLAKTMGQEELIITADTIVIVDNTILGKPVDREEAINMLQLMSGRKHQVVTGITVRTTDQYRSVSDITEVSFETLNDQEINWYLDQFDPMDKAGSYGVQDWIGSCKIKGMEGSFYNVMGLPMHRLYQLLQEI